MVDWDTLRIVLFVHRMGGLAGAARALQVSQPTVSRHLARAETDLQSKLFDRRQGRLVATDAGHIVIKEAERVETQMRRMQDDVRAIGNQMSGPISVSVPQHLLPYYVTDEIRDFQALHPDITFHVLVTDTLSDVGAGTADVVLRAEENPKPSLWGRRIARLGHSYYAHDRLLETYGSDAGCLATVCGLPLIVHDGITSSSLEETRALFPGGRVVAHSNSLEATFALIESGMGVGRLPHMVAEDLPEFHVVAEPMDAGTRRSLWILTHKDMRSVQRIERFIDFVYDRMQSGGTVFEAAERAEST